MFEENSKPEDPTAIVAFPQFPKWHPETSTSYTSPVRTPPIERFVKDESSTVISPTSRSPSEVQRPHIESEKSLSTILVPNESFRFTPK